MSIKRIFTILPWLIAIAIPVILFVMPWFIALVFVALCLWMLTRDKRGELALMLGSLLLMFACAEVLVQQMADDLFYREHERFAKRGIYLANQHQNVQIAHGDLVAMDPTIQHLANPHPATFITDDLGYRNSTPYKEQPYILLGDSFVAGVGNSAEHTLVARMNALIPNSSYSLGYPAKPNEYANHALAFLRHYPKSKARFIWFIFEGNDLSPPHTKRKSLVPLSAWQRFKRRLSVRELPLLTPRALKILYKRLGAILDRTDKKTSSVVTHKVGNQEIAFYEPYIDIFSEPELELRIRKDEVLFERTACVVIIPSKYRVYQPWIQNAPVTPAQTPLTVEVTQQFFAPYNIPVIDLGPAFQKVAKEKLTSGEHLYWPDDTHWNPNGIQIAAKQALQCMDHPN